MLFNSRVKSISYDQNIHKFEGEVEFSYSNGTVKTVKAAIVGPQRWPFERVSREILYAARFRALKSEQR